LAASEIATPLNIAMAVESCSVRTACTPTLPVSGAPHNSVSIVAWI
jgi:hypothetical protein